MDTLEEPRQKRSWLTGLFLTVSIIALIAYYIRWGFSLNFWIILIFWIVFFVVYRFITQVAIQWFLFAVFLLINILFIFNVVPGLKSGSSNSGAPISYSNSKKTTSNTVDCTSTLATQPGEAPAGYKSSIFSQGYNSNALTDTGTRVFSISALKDGSSAEDVYFRIEKIDETTIPGVKGVMEVCSPDNKALNYDTTITTTTTPASSNATAEIYYLHGGNYPVGTGAGYRIDGYINVDGTWKFVSRMTGITFNP